MRKLSFRIVTATAASAVILSFGVAATPALAHGFGSFHGLHGGYHAYGFQGYGYRGYGFRGGWTGQVRSACFAQRRLFVDASGQLRVHYVTVCS